MLKLHQLFFITFFLIFIFAFIVSAISSYVLINSINSKEITKELKNVISNVDYLVNNSQHIPFNYIKHNQKIDVLTIDGESENGYIEFAVRENILNRVKRNDFNPDESNLYGGTFSTYHTLIQKSQFKENLIIIASLNENEKFSKFYLLWLINGTIFTLSILFALFIAYYINRAVKNELTKITNYLIDIDNKNYSASFSGAFTKEFNTVAELLNILSKKLQKRDKQKRKYDAKLRFMNRQREDIISAISHEFKNPIAVILGYIQTLVDDPNMNEKLRERFLNKIATHANKISNMIDRISLATKLENSDLSAKKSDFDIYELSLDVANMLKVKYKNREISVVGESKIVNADKTMIEIVLTNLVDNALKYSKKEVIINVNSEFLSVRDFGLGIEESEIKNITKKFYRINSNSWDNSLGLGLSLVSFILQLHNYELKIESKINSGSEFIIYFNSKPQTI